MKLKDIYRWGKEFGINPLMTVYALKNISWFVKDSLKIKRMLRNNKDWHISKIYPCLHDKSEDAGSVKGHYFNQDLLVAQKIFERNPSKHVDVGSSIEGFIAHIASFRNIEVFDIRPLKTSFNNIIFRQSNLMKLDKKYIDYADSVSSLSVLEHFGLGRYGDPLDIYGYKKGFENIVKILKKNGIFYFSVPISRRQRIEFNAHRVFSIKTILNLAKENNLEVINFSYVDDLGDIHKNIKLSDKDIIDSFNLYWGCGIWEFKKI